MLIGVGPHARRIYYPICKKEESLGVKIICGVDLVEKKDEIERFLDLKEDKLPMLYISNNTYTKALPNEEREKLNKLVKKYKINGVIISTDPLAHLRYALWAIDQGLHILMDKPISAVPYASTDEHAAEDIVSDFYLLKNRHEKKGAKKIVSIMTQRRFHPAYTKIRELAEDVFKKTNCPITSVQTFHSDGQWRLPSEIVDIDYHSFNHGFGELLHSGYHSLDIICWLLSSTRGTKKEINNVDIFSQIVRPTDFISQINFPDYKNLFADFPKVNKYSEKDFRNITKKYGEIDVFVNFAFKHNSDVITLGSSNLVHNGFSQRGWLMPKKDMYKGNGRVRQETIFIEQGPFQSISLVSYQSSEINKDSNSGIFDVGGEYHLDIHVFRNSSFYPKWKTYEKLSIKDLSKSTLEGYSRGHQEDARRNAIIDFIESAKGKRLSQVSNLLDHEFGVKLISGAYLSMARKIHSKNPVVNISL